MKKVFIVLSIFLVLIALVGVAYYYYSSKSQSNNPAKTPETTLNTEPVSVPSFEDIPEVKYEPQGTFSQTDIQQLNGKYVFPINEYYKDKPTEKIKSITFKQNDNDMSSTEYPFIVSISFASGAKSETLITKTFETIDWWYPECLNGCIYSESFKSKYPEIVSATK